MAITNLQVKNYFLIFFIKQIRHLQFGIIFNVHLKNIDCVETDQKESLFLENQLKATYVRRKRRIWT